MSLDDPCVGADKSQRPDLSVDSEEGLSGHSFLNAVGTGELGLMDGTQGKLLPVRCVDNGEMNGDVVDTGESPTVVFDDFVTLPVDVNVFTPPVSKGGRVVEIFECCINGSCTCVNLVGDTHCDLKPCRVGWFLFGGECTLPSAMVEKIWDGLCDGFMIVDEGFSSSYECENYLSITEQKFRSEMSVLLLRELAEGKVTRCVEKPVCTHALGAVPKSDGKLRPITDCSVPPDESVNNFMSTTCESFVYNSVNDVTKDLNCGDYMSVVDISSAYRSVPIFPQHSKFQGSKWDFDDGKGPVYLRENRL